MIGIAMEKWPDDALRRVVDAPVEMWHGTRKDGTVTVTIDGWWTYNPATPDFAVCLYGFAASDQEPWPQAFSRLERRPSNEWPERDAEPTRYDHLCDRFGKPRTVRAIKRRALAILLKRHPLDSRLTEVRAAVSA